ncbi:MAG: mevalonate kinase [Chloroflexi bacterium SZAS-1]|jgi:mevalonate kinase|nr:mevalonate kinase [Chloroflexi bacterium SZAS-1]
MHRTPAHPITTPEITSSAPAKLILCGEHAVVYGRPAIALPLDGIRARVSILPGRTSCGILVIARDLRRRWWVAQNSTNALSELITNTLRHLGGEAALRTASMRITIRSSIPIASGMGSGAAVATALVRGLANHLGHSLPANDVSALVYASEQRFHGTPSGIDNAVIAFEQPIWFVRQAASSPNATPGDQAAPARLAPLIEPIRISQPLTLLIADTGVRSPTRAPVGDVRVRWQANPAHYEALFDEVGVVAAQIRACLAEGTMPVLGELLSQNHSLLQRIGVSSPELDALVAAATHAGALGAKLSGAGWGGVMLALVNDEQKVTVAQALRAAGARRVFTTLVQRHVGQATANEV